MIGSGHKKTKKPQCNNVSVVLRALYVLICFIPNWIKTHMYCGDCNAQENQGSGNEISAADDGVGTLKRVEQFKSKL
jgi:hypothetical protein